MSNLLAKLDVDILVRRVMLMVFVVHKMLKATFHCYEESCLWKILMEYYEVHKPFGIEVVHEFPMQTSLDFLA